MRLRTEDPTTTRAATPGSDADRSHWRPTVRTRFLGAILALSAFGLTVAGVTAYGLQRQRLDTVIDEALVRNVEEFRALAGDGVDPSTGSSFALTRDLLYVALQRTVPAPNEGMLAIVEGDVTNTAPTTVQVRLEQDPELLEAAVAAQGASSVTLRTLTTSRAEYRYVAVPVAVAGDESAGVLLLAFDRGAEHAELVRTYQTYTWVALGALALTGVVGWLLAGRLLRPIRLLRRTAQQITDTDLSSRIAVTGNDDLSDLTRTVNAMLDRLEGAFSSQRRLLDDAGHELRTPLTIIRGHLELVDPADPADVAAARAIVLDEVDRMHRLVEDMMTLASADRPDFVRREPVDVAQLTDEIVDKARHLGDHRWRVTRRADVRAQLDAQRVTQAMLQLAANATKFSPRGTMIGVASELRDDRLLMSVSDEGSGVAPADTARIFERFGRGGAGRGVEGSGLGLPIVAAIAAAHGGSAYLEHRSGPGATFVIDLPLDAVTHPTATAEEITAELDLAVTRELALLPEDEP